MSDSNVEVYYQDEEWRIGVPLETDPISRHDTREAAIAAGEAEAERRGVGLIVRDEQGTVVQQPPPGMPE
jgi:hypothetical protein